MKLFNRWVFLLVMWLCTLSAVARDYVTVFKAGCEGYSSYRIPAIVALPNHTLLAFCEGRRHNAADYGDIDLVLKQSTDGGRTWGPLLVVVDYGSLQASNPAPVLDLTDPRYPEGRLFLFYTTGNVDEQQILQGKGVKNVWYTTSTDGGRTWDSPVDITLQVHRPYRPEVNKAYAFAEDWRYYATTPGHALQLTRGVHAGRIYVAANHSQGNPRNDARQYVAHALYTDDHGKTFSLSQNVCIPGSNESMAAQLADGTVMMNSRNQTGDVRARIVSLSKDGGATWSECRFDTTLTDPVCQGSLLEVGQQGKHSVLAFCNAANSTYRDNLTLRISTDSGRTWNQSYCIYKGGDANCDYAAYSDIVTIVPQTIGILFEKDGYSSISFTTQTWKP